MLVGTNFKSIVSKTDHLVQDTLPFYLTLGKDGPSAVHFMFVFCLLPSQLLEKNITGAPAVHHQHYLVNALQSGVFNQSKSK